MTVSKRSLDDPSLKAIIEILQNEEDNLDPVYRTNFEIRQLWNLKDTLVVKSGILYRQWFIIPENNYKLLLVVPKSLRKDLMYQLHNKRVAGHLGRDKTLGSIRKRFYWPGMSSDVERWCQNCIVCAWRKPGVGLGESLMQHRPA